MARIFFLVVLTILLVFYFKSTPQTHQPALQSHGEFQANPSFTRKIVAVGDLHGDLPNALKVLQMAHVVDADGNWSGEVDFFVQTGDIIDR
jgi:hypothetical protein